jgi:hypothetical protein
MNTPTPTPPDTVNWLLQDIGPQSADIVSVVQDDTNAWAIGFQDDSQVQVHWFDNPARFELTAAVTPLPPLASREVLEGLLMFNLLSSHNGGTRMALSAPDRTLHLMRDLPSEGLNLHNLRDALRSLASMAQHWRDALAAQQTPATSPSPALSIAQESNA